MASDWMRHAKEMRRIAEALVDTSAGIAIEVMIDLIVTGIEAASAHIVVDLKVILLTTSIALVTVKPLGIPGVRVILPPRAVTDPGFYETLQLQI